MFSVHQFDLLDLIPFDWRTCWCMTPMRIKCISISKWGSHHELFDKSKYRMRILHTRWFGRTSKHTCPFDIAVGNCSHWFESCHVVVKISYELHHLSSVEYELDALADYKNLHKRIKFLIKFMLKNGPLCRNAKPSTTEIFVTIEFLLVFDLTSINFRRNVL